MNLAKVVFPFARRLKARIPIDQHELERQLKENSSLISATAIKHIQHAHTIEELQEIYRDTQLVSDLSHEVLKRVLKLKLTEEEFQQHHTFLGLLCGKAQELGIQLMVNFTNDHIDKQLYEGYRIGEIKQTPSNALKLLDLIDRFGNEQDLLQWSEGPMFAINRNALKQFYELLDRLRLNLTNKQIIVSQVEQSLPKYTHTFDLPTISLVLKHRSFNEKALNEQLMFSIIRRIMAMKELDLKPLAAVNEVIIKQLRYQDPAWINFVGKQVLKALKDHEAGLTEGAREIQAPASSTEQSKAAQEQLTMEKELELHKKIISDVDFSAIEIIDHLSLIYITPEMNYMVIKLFQDLDFYMMSILNQMSPDQQLKCFRLHSRLIETYYNETQKDEKTYRKSSIKRLEIMNNQYYEIALGYVKELSFIQTLQLLEIASVLGVSKRKVCQKLLGLGLHGLEKHEQSGLPNEQLNQCLVVYYRLLQKYTTRKEDLLKIEEKFSEIKTNTLLLQTEYGHIGIERNRLQQLSLH